MNQVLKERSNQPRLIYPAKLFLRYEKIKPFLHIQMLTELLMARPPLQKILKGAILPETKRQEDTKL